MMLFKMGNQLHWDYCYYSKLFLSRVIQQNGKPKLTVKLNLKLLREH